jgi:hypothetical protein
MMASTPAAGGCIFISYRHEDTAYPAGWLFDRLVGHFGRDQIFKDIDPIEFGDDFAEMITTAVASCGVLVVLIGDRWFTTADKDGRRTLDYPEDFVRLEIEAVLARHVRVIFVLVGQARMTGAEELPASLAKLPRLQALKLRPSYFESDIATLRRCSGRRTECLPTHRSQESTLPGKIPTARPENTCNMPSRRHGSDRRPATRSSKGLTSRRHLARKLRRSGKPGSRQVSNTGGG